MLAHQHRHWDVAMWICGDTASDRDVVSQAQALSCVCPTSIRLYDYKLIVLTVWDPGTFERGAAKEEKEGVTAAHHQARL